jgi:hypothetical protein
MEISEGFARRLFMQAVEEGRAAELLACLFDGGSATVDVVTGKLVLASADMLKQIGGN